jgi:hypothetical protein
MSELSIKEVAGITGAWIAQAPPALLVVLAMVAALGCGHSAESTAGKAAALPAPRFIVGQDPVPYAGTSPAIAAPNPMALPPVVVRTLVQLY